MKKGYSKSQKKKSLSSKGSIVGSKKENSAKKKIGNILGKGIR